MLVVYQAVIYQRKIKLKILKLFLELVYSVIY